MANVTIYPLTGKKIFSIIIELGYGIRMPSQIQLYYLAAHSHRR